LRLSTFNKEFYDDDDDDSLIPLQSPDSGLTYT